MAYTKQTWTDRQVENPMTFTMTTNDDGTVTLTPAPGTISEPGSLITAERMNHIEDGIEQMNISNIIVVTCSVITPVANNDSLTGTATIDYPSGFTKSNCMVAGLLGNNSAINTSWSTPTESTSLGYVSGAGGLRAILNDDNIMVQRTKSDVIEPTSTSDIKILLMKITE